MEGNTSHSQKSIFIFFIKINLFLSVHSQCIWYFQYTIFPLYFHHFHRVSTTCTLNDIEINPTTVPMHHRESGMSNRD